MSTSPPRSIELFSERGTPDSGGSSHLGAAPPGKILNLAEAALFVRCSRAHLCNIVNGKVRGIPKLPAVRIGRRVLFRRESLERWLQQVESANSVGLAR